jgi:hypothetical protein
MSNYHTTQQMALPPPSQPYQTKRRDARDLPASCSQEQQLPQMGADASLEMQGALEEIKMLQAKLEQVR